MARPIRNGAKGHYVTQIIGQRAEAINRIFRKILRKRGQGSFFDIAAAQQYFVPMPRQRRYTPGGTVFHVINRGVGQRTLFHKDEDYAAFERVMAAAFERVPIRILAYCLMPNHWHMVLWPRTDSELPEFVKWLTHTHTQRWHALRPC